MTMRMTIGQIITGAAGALFGLGLVVMIAITSTAMWLQARTQMQRELSESFGEIGSLLNATSSEMKGYAGLLARHPDIVEAMASDSRVLARSMQREFQALRGADPEIEVVEMLDPSGTVVHRAHRPDQAGDNKASQPIVAQAMRNGQAVSLTYSASSQQLAFVGIEAVRWQGKVIGYMTVGKRLSTGMLQRLARSTHSDISLAMDGAFIRSTRADVSNASFAPGDLQQASLAARSFTMTTASTSLLAHAAAVPRDGGSPVVFVLSRDTALITERFISFILWPAIVGLTALILLTPLLMMAGKRFSRMIDDLAMAMRDLAGGAIDTTIPHLRRHDELGDMARAVEVFQDNAIKVREQDRERAAEAERAAQRLAALESFNARTEVVISDAVRGELSVRVPEEGAPDGLAAMAQNLNRLLASFEQTISLTVAGMERIAEGELTSRVSTSFDGEFRRMTAAANALAERFQHTIGDIVAVTQDVKSATDEIVVGVNDLSQRTAQQAEISEQTMSRLSSFAGTFRSASEMASTAARTADEAERYAGQGEGFVIQTRDAMGRISAASRRISDITTIIADVAFQTNLLALNAAVEAARAGEAGRGFAVVATEVRALAERAADASRNVKQLVDGAVGEIDTGVDAVGHTEAAFRDISAAVKTVAGMVRGMSQSTGSQASAVDQLGGEIERLGEMAQQNAALVEQSNAMLENANSRIADLARLARQFRIGAPDEVRPMARAA